MEPVSSSQTPGVTFSPRSAQDFVELHDQVQTSVNLLDSLESFLSTFQTDLSAVAGQIAELQNKSNEIDGRLKSRKKIEKPLTNLLNEITISPSLATLILDSPVGDAWLPAVEELEQKMHLTGSRSRVKAAKDLAEVTEGLRIVAATKLRAFFLSTFKPIRASVTTNLQVLQTSVLMKYKPLYAFLQRQAPNVALELQKSYSATVRTYYETGFRRYIRSLGWIKGRTTEKYESITSPEHSKDWSIDEQRLAYAKVDGPSVTLAFMGDDKNHVEPVEATIRSLLLVFMDNATAEYTFVKSFFATEAPLPTRPSASTLLSPASVVSPSEHDSVAGGSEYGHRSRVNSVTLRSISATLSQISKEDQTVVDTTWKQIFDPVLGYVQTFIKTTVEPIPPPLVSLLTMIRLTEDVAAEVENRGCPPVSTFVFALRLQLWPVFQTNVTDSVNGLKTLAEGTSVGYFSRSTVSESTVLNVCNRYVVLFCSFISLTEQEEETMIFSNLLRLRQELFKLIIRHTEQKKELVSRMTAQASLYDRLLHGLSEGIVVKAHPKAQQELAYWANREEEARRKIMSATQPPQRQR